MKGIIFNILEQFIEAQTDEGTWEEILDQTDNKNEVYVAPKTYPDKELLSIVSSAVKLLKLDMNDTVRAFGRFTFPILVKKIPEIREKLHTPQEFIHALDNLIHVEVHMFLAESQTPKFKLTHIEAENYELLYESKRNLPYLVMGLIDGLAKEYKTKIDIEIKQVNTENTLFEVRIYG